MIQINAMPDHRHLLVRLRPSMAPSKFIQAVKANSSRWINEKNFLSEKFTWQKGGAVFSVDYRNVSTVVKYIEDQKEHHRKSGFKEEYLDLLSQFGIKFEEGYLLEFFD